MSELFDTTELRDDSEHWDAMAERVAAAVVRAQTPSLLDWLASSRIVWLTAAIAVMTLLVLVLWEPEPSARATQTWVPLIAPADSSGKIMTIADRPPAIETLLDNRLRSGR